MNRLLHEGRNARVTLEGNSVRKVLRVGGAEEAIAYYHELKQTPLDVPHTSAESDSALIQRFMSEGSLAEKLASPTAADAFEATARAIDAFLAARPHHVGLSPKPSNFVFHDGKPHYVDFTPSYRQGNRKDVFHYTNKGIRTYFAYHVIAKNPVLAPRVMQWLINRPATAASPQSRHAPSRRGLFGRARRARPRRE